MHQLSKSEVKEKEKPAKLEDVAEETGELIGKGLKKALSVTKSLGKGLVDTLEKTDKREESMPSTCPHCGASVPLHSNFCASCGKKL